MKHTKIFLLILCLGLGMMGCQANSTKDKQTKPSWQTIINLGNSLKQLVQEYSFDDACIPTDNKIINNGGQHVVWKQYTYMWKYQPTSFSQTSLRAKMSYTAKAKNQLLCINAKGQRRILYEGDGCGPIWIVRNRLYIQRGDGVLFSIDFNGKKKKVYGAYTIKAQCKNGDLIMINVKGNIRRMDIAAQTISRIVDAAVWKNFQDDVIYYTDQKLSSDSVTLSSIHADGSEKKTLAIFYKKDIQIPKIPWDSYAMFIPCVQIFKHKLYATYGYYAGTAIIYEAGNFVEMDLDGTHLKIKKISPKQSFDQFTMIENKGNVILKKGHAQQKPFSDTKGNIWIYPQTKDKEELLIAGKDYPYHKKIYPYEQVQQVDRAGDMVYYTYVEAVYEKEASIGWRPGFRWKKLVFYQKNLKTRKVRRLYQLSQTI